MYEKERRKLRVREDMSYSSRSPMNDLTAVDRSIVTGRDFSLTRRCMVNRWGFCTSLEPASLFLLRKLWCAETAGLPCVWIPIGERKLA